MSFSFSLDESTAELAGKNAFVTGGASGIGLELIRRLLSEGSENSELSHLVSLYGSSRLKLFQCDVGSRQELKRSFEQAINSFGCLDIVVNNAGIVDLAADLTVQDDVGHLVSKVLDIDLLAVVEGTRLALQHMSKRGAGVVVNVASNGGLLPMPFAPVYCAAKHGVVGFSRSLYHLAARNIRVNCICPSFVDTPMVALGVQESSAMRAAVKAVGGLLSAAQVVDGIMQLVTDTKLAGSVMLVTAAKGAQVIRYPSWHQPHMPLKSKM